MGGKTSKLIFILIALFVNLNFVFACIDVNSASLSDLDELYGIGPAKAQAIIDARPYSSVDDLIKAYGIGEVTLQNIKSQGLACVEGELVEEPKEEIVPLDVPKTIEEESKEENIETNTIEQEEKSSPEVLSLNSAPKVIKSEDSSEEESENKIAILGLTAFCVVLAGLFLVKGNRYKKNEFR